MEYWEVLGITIMSFILGVMATSFGTNLGKSLETRKELLMKMAKWVEEVVFRVGYFMKIMPFEEWTEDEKRTYYRLVIEGMTWTALAETKYFGDKKLIKEVNEFISAFGDINPNESVGTIEDKYEIVKDQGGALQKTVIEQTVKRKYI